MAISAQPSLNVITSKQDRRSAGVGIPYADAYNQSQMAKYNNEYNYWLWQQQQEYNSPSNQRKRLEEAGLNPNYQSIDSGNVGSLPTSSGSIAPSIGSNHQRNVQNALQIANGILDSVSQGIRSMSELSGIPSDIGAYRRYLSDLGFFNSKAAENKYLSSAIDAVFDSWMKGGLSDPQRLFYYGYTGPDGQVYSDVLNPAGSPAGKQATLRNASMQLLNSIRGYDLEHMRPAELEKLNSQIQQIGAAAGLTQEQLKLYNLTQGTKVVDTIFRLLIEFLNH